MYYLEDKKRKFIIFWSARVACTSLKEWFKKLGGENEKTAYMTISKMKCTDKILNSKLKKIVVVRDPVKRFVSILNHYSLIGLYIHDKTKGRIEKLLRLLEKKGTTINHHFELQCYVHDDWEYGDELHKRENFIGYFDEILKLEDGPLIPRLNSLLGLSTPDVVVNTTARNNLAIEGVEIVTVDDLTVDHIKRIQNLYYYDYFNFEYLLESIAYEIRKN